MKLWSMSAAMVALVLVAVAPEANGGGGTPITSCAQTLTTNAFLTGDQTCGSTSGVVVGADGITIDLQGFTLQGDGSANHYGIEDNGFDGVKIKNGVVQKFTDGVHAFNSADNLSVSNLVASGNFNDGVYIAGASAKIQAATVSGDPVNGIEVSGALARIMSSTAVANGNRGIRVVGNSASVISSTASGNAIIGMVIQGSSAKIQKSTAFGNFVDGIDVIGDSATVSSTTVSGNSVDGLNVEGEAAVIKSNRADANGFQTLGGSDLLGLGIRALGYTRTPPIGTNTARGNDEPGQCEPANLC